MHRQSRVETIQQGHQVHLPPKPSNFSDKSEKLSAISSTFSPSPSSFSSSVSRDARRASSCSCSNEVEDGLVSTQMYACSVCYPPEDAFSY
jgi:hypothetical protein